MHGHRSFWMPEEIRRQLQNPELILGEIGLKRGMTFVDVGCGEGFFAIPAARIVGEAGKVLAVDASADAISRLKEKADKDCLPNITLSTGTAEDAVLCQACADIVFFGIVLHDFANPGRVLLNARNMLKPSGELVNLDWKKEPMDWGPPLVKRFNEMEATRLVESAGFTVTRKDSGARYHYIIFAKAAG